MANLDLQLVAEGFVRQYKWDIALEEGRKADLGSIELTQGSSIVGWVVADSDPDAVNLARVTLKPRQLGDRGLRSVHVGRLGDLVQTTHTNERGFFQYIDIRPGEYIIEVSQEQLVPARATVRVLENDVTEIANPPLMLRPPLSVEIYVDPPVPPFPGQWWLQVERLGMTGRSSLETVDAKQVELTGIWRHDGMAPGRYRLQVGPNPEETWHFHEFEIDAEPPPIFIDMDVVEIRGEVWLGENPLAASIWFGGESSAISIPLESDEEGMFRGHVPWPGFWEVEVKANGLPLQRRFQRVEVEKNPVKGHAVVDLQIPQTLLTGRVVDSNRNPRRATVTAQSLDDVVPAVRKRTDELGRFEIIGLPPGRATALAEGSEGSIYLYAGPMELDLVDGEEHQIELELRPEIEISGRVVMGGLGIPGARVKAEPVGLLGVPVFPPTTDETGFFSLSVPERAREILVTVSAPGFAFRMLRVSTEIRDLVLPVGTEHGALILDLPGDLDRQVWGSEAVYVLHNGAFERLEMLQSWARVNQMPSDRMDSRIVIPMMEPGRYSACIQSPTHRFLLLEGNLESMRCVSGYLDPAGELHLQLADSEDSTGGADPERVRR